MLVIEGDGEVITFLEKEKRRYLIRIKTLGKKAIGFNQGIGNFKLLKIIIYQKPS